MTGIASAGAEPCICRIRDLVFCDLYLGHPVLEPRYAASPGAPFGQLPPHPALRDDVERLTGLCTEAVRKFSAHANFKVRHDAVTYRGVALPTSGGTVFFLRRLEGHVPTLAALGVPQPYARRMLGRYLSGLFIICGEQRSGRTSIASAMLKERLQAHGGLGVTGEDPVELPLEGEHGAGLCFQTTVPHEPSRFSAAFGRLLRSGAGTLLIDGINSAEAAAAVLQASGGGMLVIVTMQAEDIIQCLFRLHALASEKLSADNARGLLAESLAGVLHLHLCAGPQGRPKLEAGFFHLEDNGARGMLRMGEYEHLGTMLRQQMVSMLNEHAAVSRIAKG